MWFKSGEHGGGESELHKRPVARDDERPCLAAENTSANSFSKLSSSEPQILHLHGALALEEKCKSDAVEDKLRFRSSAAV
jgi:hypothetical protein